MDNYFMYVMFHARRYESVARGKVHLCVPGEFRAVLTLGGVGLGGADGSDHADLGGWRVLALTVLVAEAGKERAAVAMNEMQNASLRHELAARMSHTSTPLLVRSRTATSVSYS